MINNLYDYQQEAILFVTYPRDRRWEYLPCGLNGEAGEVSDKVKRIIRGDYVSDSLDIDLPTTWPADVCRKTMLELGDVLWYLSIIAWESQLPIPPSDDFSSNYADLLKLDIFQLSCMINSNCAKISDRIIEPGWEDERWEAKTVVLSHIFSTFEAIDRFAQLLDCTLLDVAKANIAKLSARKKADKLNGEGDER